jgi:hypothetical protein
MYGKMMLAWLSVLSLACGAVARAEVFKETFDTYAAGSQMHGQGAWKGWDNTPGAGALVSNGFSYNSPNSVNITGGSDLVHTWSGLTSSRYEFSAMQYIPSSSTGTTYFILLNKYNDGGPYDWSVQVSFNLGTSTILDEQVPDPKPTMPLIKDQWVKIVADIDLDADKVDFYYNNTLLSTHTWTSGADSVLEIKAVDLFANSAGPVYYDNVVIRQVPEPSVVCLLGTGLVALGLAFRRRWK